MATKDDIIAAIQTAADATGNGNLRISLGATGNHVENSIGETRPTGQAWEPEPKTWPVIAQGLADWADSLGLSDLAAIKAKVNELCSSHNQLIIDYDNGTVPTTAPPVTPLP